MPKPVKKKRAAKKPSTDPIVRARQLMQEQMEKVEAGSTFWKPGTSVRHVQSDEQPVPDLDKMPTPKQISALMRELGRKGGKASGAKRMQNLSERKRKEIARKAAAARWGKKTTG